MASVFFSYSHADEAMRDQLEVQLALLKRQGVIETWHDRRIGAGEEFAAAIDRNLEDADVVLLLVSPDFISSDYCYNREMKRAMERHEAKDAIVIPVILRACLWHDAPFAKLNATPPNGLPISQATDRDQAFLEVAKAIKAAAERIGSIHGRPSPLPAAPVVSSAQVSPLREDIGPRSSNLRLRKEFSERDLDGFRVSTFEFVAKFFENSLVQLGERNAGVEGVFRRIDANRFTAAVYKGGKAVARCTIFMGGSGYGFGSAIGYAHGETNESSAYNDMLTANHDDQSMFLNRMAQGGYGGERRAKLTQEGAAEAYWSMFIGPLQET